MPGVLKQQVRRFDPELFLVLHLFREQQLHLLLLHHRHGEHIRHQTEMRRGLQLHDTLPSHRLPPHIPHILGHYAQHHGYSSQCWR